MRHGLSIILGIIKLAACSVSSTGREARPTAAGHLVAPNRTLRILKNPDFVVGCNAKRRCAPWMAFRLHGAGHFQPLHRPEFTPDPRLKLSQQRTNYRELGYGRGLIETNYAMRKLYGRSAQRVSFYTSNIIAQRSRLNQLDWQRLEELEVDHVAPWAVPLWVVTGPVPAKVGGLPRKFYRIWLVCNASGYWRLLAIIVPQRARVDEWLSRYRVLINTIESVTSINFSKLGRRVKNRLETQVAPVSTFGFSRYACQPARYWDGWQNRNDIHLNFDRCGG